MAAPVADHQPLPPFPDMIFAAISALGDANDTSKSAIVKYVETQYANLPADHEAVLADHLDKMKESGQLLLSEDGNYARAPAAEAAPPARRGRGRPPKPKPAVPAGAVASPPRPRGRPPKQRDPNAAPVSTAQPPRPRGRPPKRGPPAGSLVTGSSRPRGRPPKAKSPFPVVGFD